MSHQTVLNHFSSKAGVALAVAELISAETTDIRNRATPGDVAGAVHLLVGEYERFGDANVRWAATAERLGVVARCPGRRPSLAPGVAGHDVRRTSAVDATARRRAVNALHAATDVYTWKLLRRDLGLSRAETERTIVQLVEGILDRQPREAQP